MPDRIYLDYNVIEALSKDRICLPKGDYDIYCSVAHGEEYYKACCNATSEYLEAALQIKEIIKRICKKGVVLNPSKKRVIAKVEKFEDCIERIKKYDTRDVVNKNGSLLFHNNKEAVSELRKADNKSTNNSNLSYNEIWLRPEVIKYIEYFPDFYNDYLNLSNNALLKIYGHKNFLRIKNNQKFPKEFTLAKDCFKKDYSFALLEMVIEFLNDNVLCACGYCKDKTERTTQSGIHDVSHMIYATYCDYFVSKDSNLIKRAQAIYYYLGLNTQAINLNDWLLSKSEEK